MSGSVNKVILIGNLGNDPEVRTAPDQFQVCTFNLATNRDWKDRNTGKQKSQTNWHSVVVWEPNAVTYAKNFLKKGAKVYVKGKLYALNLSAIRSRRVAARQTIRPQNLELLRLNCFCLCGVS